MKAIFAVTALAAAISAQAIAADTESTTTFSGNVNVGSTFDLDAQTRDMSIIDSGDDGWNLDAEISVVNGGFTGSLSIEGNDGNASVSMGDLLYTEGAIMFGDVDSIVTTSAPVDDMTSGTDYGVDKGFRYTNEDLGIKLQAEVGTTNYDADLDGDVDGDDEDVAGYNTALTSTDFGLAAAYMGDFDVVTVAADLQYRESPLAGSPDEALALYAGVKVVATPVDMLTVTAGYSTGHDIAVANFQDADSTIAQYGVRADVAVMENVSAYAYYSVVGEADANIKVGAEATFSPVKVEASYDVDAEEFWAKVSLAEEMEVSAGLMVGAYAEAEYATDLTWVAGANTSYAITEMLKATASFDIDSDSETLLKAGLAYTTEGGAALTADYENESAAWDDGLSHKVTLKASYSF